MTHQRNDARPLRETRSSSPRTLTRRRVVSGALGAAGAAAIGAGVTRLDNVLVSAQGATAVEFAEPPVCRSVDGVLETILIAQEGMSNVHDSTMNFNGIVPGPTLRLAQGERLRIKLINRLPPSVDPLDMSQHTNLHVHGLHVSPLGHGDDVLRVNLGPGEKWVYEYDIRPDHQAGTFWYHPHHHGSVWSQVRAGMAGAIIIEGDLDTLPQVQGASDRLLVLQGNFSDGSLTYLVNGQPNPTIRMTLGERQRWRILNASYKNFYNLELADPDSADMVTMQRISVDGNYLRELVPTDRLLLGPAERAEVLIEPLQAKTFRLFSRAWDGPPSQPEIPLLTLVVAAAAAPEAAENQAPPLSPDLVGNERLPDLRSSVSPVLRTLSFEPTQAGTFPMTHTEGGIAKVFDPDVVDQWVKLGATEQWIIQNHTATHWHPFHLHVNDLQVVESSDETHLQPFVFYKDTVPVPPGGEVKLLIPFLHFTGRFVYHCHILEHEDKGMMGVIDVMQPIDIVDSVFSLETIEVPLQTTVEWTNLDGYDHTVTADGGAFDSGPLQQADSYRFLFDTPGTYTYHCEFHPKMHGTIVVPEVAEPVEPLEVPIDIAGSTFAPTTIEIASCQTVVWTNRDEATPHFLAAEDGQLVSGALNTGDTFYRTFYVPGVYTYRLDGNPEQVVIVNVT